MTAVWRLRSVVNTCSGKAALGVHRMALAVIRPSMQAVSDAAIATAGPAARRCCATGSRSATKPTLGGDPPRSFGLSDRASFSGGIPDEEMVHGEDA